MKKAIFFMVAASAMLAACSNEEALEVNNGRAIEFRHGMKSRAADLHAGNLNSFTVSAYVNGSEYFSHVEFAKPNAESTTFTSNTLYYWPGDGSEVNFTAFAPYDLGATITNGSVSIDGFTVDGTNANQIDFLVGGCNGTRANETTGVLMTFGHVLSQIEIMAKSSSETYKFEISDVKLVNIPNKGSYNGSAWTIDDDADNATYSYELPSSVTLSPTATPLMTKMVGETETNNNLILIPQLLTAWEPNPKREAGFDPTTVGAYIAVKLKVTAANGAVQIFPFKDGDKVSEWAAVPVDTEWVAGNKYTYILDFTNGAGWVAPDGDVDPEEPILQNPITFTVEVTPWTTEGNSLEPKMGEE